MAIMNVAAVVILAAIVAIPATLIQAPIVADPAVVAVVFANVADLDQAAHKNAVAVDRFAHTHGGALQQRVGFFGAFRKQRFKGGGVQ